MLRQIMDLYREQLLDHYHAPRNWGLEEGGMHLERGSNLPCGDEVTVQLWRENEKVLRMRFEGHGCVISTAAASLLSEHVIGMDEEQVLRLGLEDMQQLLGTPLQPNRIPCALLALKTVQKILA